MDEQSGCLCPIYPGGSPGFPKHRPFSPGSARSCNRVSSQTGTSGALNLNMSNHKSDWSKHAQRLKNFETLLLPAITARDKIPSGGASARPPDLDQVSEWT